VSHAHGHAPGAADAQTSDRGRLLVALGLAVVTVVVEVWGGVLTGSLALLADAGHVFADVGALLLALFALWLAGRPHTAQETYGYHRAEVLAATLNALLLLAISALIGWEAVRRLQARPEVHGLGLLAVASAGLAANLAQALVLRHAHSINTRAARLHVLSDAAGSLVAIAAGAGVALTGWTPLDPALSLVIGALVIVGAVRMLRETLDILMEHTPAGLDTAAFAAALLADPDVLAVHEVHLWTITSGFDAFTAHVQVRPGADPVAVARRCGEVLHARFGIEHATIQPEFPPLIEIGDSGAR
jgi:cobalt-zinc-cadmium efflux system protein